jgi:hypothetical protein
MANTQRPELSSVFDDMLAQNKKRFDDLFGSGRRLAATTPFAGSSTAPRSGAPAPSARLDAESGAARRLNERFGSDWRFEITERERVGDEAIVVCKLTFGTDGAVRSQFGRAAISAGPVAGASGGLRFRVGAADQDERDAFRRATEAALMNCIALI